MRLYLLGVVFTLKILRPGSTTRVFYHLHFPGVEMASSKPSSDRPFSTIKVPASRHANPFCAKRFVPRWSRGVVRHGNVLVSIPYLVLVIPSYLATRSSWSTPSAPPGFTSAQRHEILSDGRKQSYFFFPEISTALSKAIVADYCGLFDKEKQRYEPRLFISLEHHHAVGSWHGTCRSALRGSLFSPSVVITTLQETAAIGTSPH